MFGILTITLGIGIILLKTTIAPRASPSAALSILQYILYWPPHWPPHWPLIGHPYPSENKPPATSFCKPRQAGPAAQCSEWPASARPDGRESAASLLPATYRP